MKNKSAYDIKQELHSFIRALPLIKPEDMAVGDLFVDLCHGGYDGAIPFRVVSKTPTLLRYDYYSPEALRSEKPFSSTFKSLAKKNCGLYRATPEQARKAVEFNKAIILAEEHAKNFVKRSRDIYVVWNHACEDVGPERNSDTIYAPREGFVLEIFNGNGRQIERIRMLTEGSDGLNQHCDYDVIERMIKAYAALHFDHDAVRNGAKFQIIHAPQID